MRAPTLLTAVYALALAAAPVGCRPEARRATTVPVARVIEGLQSPHYDTELHAVVAPPAGWNAERREDSTARGHRVWVSPTGRTAYGVIQFALPLPVGHDPVLWVFLREMRRSEGQAELLSKQWDPNLRMLRFVAKGGLYTVRTNLLVRGFNGWAVYAGTLTGERVEVDELSLAERAREHTLVGRAAAESAAP